MTERMSEIPPAMTPDEWEGKGFRLGACSTMGFRYDWVDIELDDCGRDCMCHALDAGERHKAAAACLHNQPFGFAQGDVENLRHIGNSPACGPARGGALLDLADRIAALLPPVTP